MDRPLIRTYSRKQPVAVFKSSSTYIPSYDPTNRPNVRESRLNDKTLEVDYYEDEFDRLATGFM